MRKIRIFKSKFLHREKFVVEKRFLLTGEDNINTVRCNLSDGKLSQVGYLQSGYNYSPASEIGNKSRSAVR